MQLVKDEKELRKPCEPVKLTEVKDIIKKFPAIVKVMMENKGVGLASVQVGIHKTFFIANVNQRVRLFINPKITYYSEDTNIDDEGCLSVPGITAKIKRSNKITLQHFHPIKLKMVKEDFSGYAARIIQHEYDHLQGIICVLDKGE